MEFDTARSLLEMKLFQEEDFLLMKIFCFISCVISLLSSLSIILIFIFIKRVRTFAFKLVFYLSLSDFCLNIGNVITIQSFRNLNGNDHTTGSFCITQGFLSTLFGLSSIIWPTLIAFSLWITVVKHHMNIEKNEFIYILCGYAMPFCLAIIPFFFDGYGPEGLYCWMKDIDGNHLQSLIFRLCCFYIFLWMSFLFISFSLYKVIVTLNRMEVYSKNDKYIMKMKFYPAILFICWFWGSVRFISEFFDSNNKRIIWLAFLHAFFGCLQGFFNFVFYGLNYEVKQIFKKMIFKCCCCFNRKSCLKKSTDGIELDQTRRGSGITDENYTEENLEERNRQDSSTKYCFAINESYESNSTANNQ